MKRIKCQNLSSLHLGGGYFTNKNVKGFTLIELLAVIVILAIIATIATPIILGIIGETKEKAFKLSLKNAEHAYEIYEVQHNIKPGTEVNIKDLPLDSNLSGTISTNEEGKVELKNVTDGTYSASGPVDDINMIKGTPEDLLKNILTVKVNTNYSSRNIVITVETIEGIPTSYSYKIEGPDNYKKEVNNVTSNNQTFNKLKPNTEYSIIVTVKNKAGLTKEITKTGKTLSIDNITLDLNPKDEYISSGKVTITYPNIEEGLINKYKWEDDETFTTVTGNSVEVPAKNGTLIAIVSDGEEVVTQNSITINNVDDIDPVLTLNEVQKTTNSITIPYSIIEEHISEITCKYSDINGTYTSNGEVGENVCTLSKLTNEKTYYYEICVTDIVGNNDCKTGSTKPSEITNPEITITHTPSNAGSSTTNGYSREEVANITFNNTNITTPTYYIKSTIAGTTNKNVIGVCGTGDKPGTCTTSSTTNITVNTWYKVNGNINITYNPTTSVDTNHTVYATTYDGQNYKDGATATLLKIDKDNPNITLGNVTKTTNSMAINYTLSDTKSGVDTDSVTCKLGVSKGTYNISGTATSTSCTATGLKNNQDYYYKICLSDLVGNNKCYETNTSTSTETITNPEISVTHTPSNAGLSTTNGYSKEEVAHITFDSTNITTPTYYIKSTIVGTTNKNVIGSCGTEDKPGTCTTTSTTSISANTWYKVSGDINVTYNTATSENGTVYAITYDETNYSGASTGTILKIDTKGPTYTISVNLGNVTITASDPAGLHSKAYSCDGSWQASNICIFTSSGSHTVNVRDALENDGEEDTVTISEYHDTTSNASTPALNSLTPVVYKNNNWVVANTTAKWYDYTNQEWGNAVLLNSGVTKNVGDTVTVTGSNPEAIAMFVWIPRFEYKIEGTYGTHSDGTAGTADLPGEIEVKFIQKSKTTADTGYRIHPAFTFGTEELDGIWVGKFETSHTTLSSSTTANNLGCSDNNCSNADGLRVLPNVVSLRYNNVSNFFYATQSMGNRLNIDGDLHIAKNSEWGAAAYLSQSKYGKYGNSSYSGAEKEVAINSNSSYLTGGGNYTSNIAQSTTGNITGIYDMSGGAWEYVMGVYNKTVSSSGINFSSLDAKYYDNYTSTTPTTACTSEICYGHALSETAGWYGDYTAFVNSSNPWVLRGGYCGSGTGAGVFASDYNDGGSYGGYSFRVVLSQTT